MKIFTLFAAIFVSAFASADEITQKMHLEVYVDSKSRSVATLKCINNDSCKSKYLIDNSSIKYLTSLTGKIVNVTLQVDKMFGSISGGMIHKVNNQPIKFIMPLCISKTCKLGFICGEA